VIKNFCVRHNNKSFDYACKDNSIFLNQKHSLTKNIQPLKTGLRVEEVHRFYPQSLRLRALKKSEIYKFTPSTSPVTRVFCQKRDFFSALASLHWGLVILNPADFALSYSIAKGITMKMRMLYLLYTNR